MTVRVDIRPDGAIWGRGSNQVTPEPGKGSCEVEVRSDRFFIDDSKS